eukprot:5367374-Prymnesium_polylepis.1
MGMGQWRPRAAPGLLAWPLGTATGHCSSPCASPQRFKTFARSATLPIGAGEMLFRTFRPTLKNEEHGAGRSAGQAGGGAGARRRAQGCEAAAAAMWHGDGWARA